MNPAPLLRYGEHQHVSQLEEKTQCTECGNRDGNTVKVFKLGR